MKSRLSRGVLLALLSVFALAVLIMGCAKRDESAERTKAAAPASQAERGPAAKPHEEHAAGDEHDAAEHDEMGDHQTGEAHHDAEESLVTPNSLSGVWREVETNRAKLGEVVRSGRLAQVHLVAFRIRDLVAAMPALSSGLDESKRSQLADASRRVGQIAGLLDQYGDAGDSAATEAQAKRMESVLDYIKNLYPVATFTAGSADPAAQTRNAATYACPMHPEEKQSQPGRCTKCGMNLEAVAAPAGASEAHDQSQAGEASEGAAHTDHNGKHGGSLGMKGDYHVELVVRNGGNVEVYLYDAYTKPLSTSGLRGSVSLETLGAGGGSPKVRTTPLTPDARGEMLIAQVSEVAAAKWATVTVNLPEVEVSMTLPLD